MTGELGWWDHLPAKGAVHIVAAGLAIKKPWLALGGQILMNELRK